jgi:hypothetical protein
MIPADPMPMKVFVSHWSGDSEDVKALNGELRLHGIFPWVDKDGGFRLGDDTQTAVRHVLEREASGLLLYATKTALSRKFITRLEIESAIRIKERNPNFMLVVIACGIGFNEISTWALENFGFDLANFHSHVIPRGVPRGALGSHFQQIAVLATNKILHTAAQDVESKGYLSMQFLTRGAPLPTSSDRLVIDASWLIEGAPCSPERWGMVHASLLNVKKSITKEIGLLPLRFHGFRHLTGAFLLGRVFARPSGFIIETQQNGEYWSTNSPLLEDEPLKVQRDGGSVESEALFVEISTGDKMVADGVRRLVQAGIKPHAILRLVPKAGLDSTAVKSNAMASSIAVQVRSEVSKALIDCPVSSVHIFAAVPHSVATFIGYELNAFPPIHLYEYDGLNYVESIVIR